MPINRFLQLSFKISILWGNGHYFESTLIKSFLPITPKTPTFRAWKHFSEITFKNSFFAYIPKYHYSKSRFCFNQFDDVVFRHNSYNFKISRKISLNWFLFKKIIFVKKSIFAGKNQHVEEKYLFLSLLKISFIKFSRKSSLF